MPQLDSVAYVSQVIWFIAGFLGLYFGLLSLSLPRLHKILKFRKFLLSLLKSDILYLKKELFYSNYILNSVVLDFNRKLSNISQDFGKKVDLHIQICLNNILRGSVNRLNVFSIAKKNIGYFSRVSVLSRIRSNSFLKESAVISKKINS